MNTNITNILLPKELYFRGKWRSYQERVLEELQIHLSDKKLNVVAAPGAGKTTLGIEVLQRLGNPALVLAPTITIKNQWKRRIIDGFLPEDFDDSFISDDIKNVSTITITTYQAIHSIYKNAQERKELINKLKENNIKTLVLDEAHHLRTEWYSTLENLRKQLNDESFTTVSLTGTPPYDVSLAEWNNYHSLCGPVDAEISIPELVKNGDLCPHQDLIYFSNLTKEEEATIFDFESKRKEFFDYIEKESDFLYSIESSIFVSDYENNIEIIYADTSFTVSIISYLLKHDALSPTARILSDFLGLTIEQIPQFDYEIAETLLNGMLGKNEQYFNNISIIKNKLRELNLLKSNKVDFLGQTNFKNLLARSNNKLQAIKMITENEYKNLGNNLKEVILLDYIGKGDNIGLNIFSAFDKLYDTNLKLGILTGTVMVIPESAKSALYEILTDRDIDNKKVLTSNFKEKYLRVETYGQVDIVSAITELFALGYINVLIGTQALLGEGWDSPCVNSLVIASTVGSFMLSNQMRGRALRIDKNNPDKTANIWHLVSLGGSNNQISDFEIVEKRFNTFEGISYNDNKIKNGLDRLDISNISLSKLNCESLNQKMFVKAQDRNNLVNMWGQVFKGSAITEKKITSRIYEVIENTTAPKLPAVCTKMSGWFMRGFVLKLFEKYAAYTSLNDQRFMATCILKALLDAGIIKTSPKEIFLKNYIDEKKHSYLTIVGCTNYERNLFVKCYGELFSPPDNQRYILKKEDKYIVVPDLIGSNKKYVANFAKYLSTKLGYFDIIFTRNPAGYKKLLQAKYNQYKTLTLKKSRVWI